MNNFVVSARKYRPATFDTVVGQSHITNTLKNAIRDKHLAQAFLFCGPRGVGKTTCARILAKTINCHSVSATVEACNQCDSCIAFNAGQSLNIYELDAASNNSVDDIRALVEQVRYAPHSGEFKIYIIDEVHMLSPGAFNAFLKTLEEPPPYAIFILATTEKHKIIPTILSRCQIFDFNRIQVDDIVKHLAYVATQENVKAETDALHIIAQKADGALRDSLSIFDQIVSFAGNTITYKDVINNLNILDYEYYFSITDDMREGKIPSVLLTFNELLNDGFDGHHFVNGLASHFRDLLVCQDESTLKLLEVSQNIRERYKTQAKQTPPSLLLKLLQVCSKCDIDYRAARNQRLHVELALIKMCSLNIAATTAAEKKTPDVISLPSFSGKATATPAIQKEKVFAPVSLENQTAAAPNLIPATVIISPPTTVSSAGADPDAAALQLDVVKEKATPYPSKTFVPKTVSISAAMNGKKQDANEDIANAAIETREDSFTQEKLIEVWNDYAQRQKTLGKPQLFITLTSRAPVIIENNFIELEIQNQSQEKMMVEERQDLIDFLRKQLNNYKLQLRTKVNEQSNNENEAYTNKEKYQKMVEKNPELEEFRKQLGFELEL